MIRTRLQVNCVALMVAVTTMASSAHAEQSYCVEILRQGVYDYYSEKNSSLQLSDVRAAILESESRSQSAAAGGGGGVGFGPFSLGGHYSKEEAEATAKLFTREDSELVNVKSELQVNIKRINPKAWDAFNQCMALGVRGLQVRYSMRPDYGAFAMSLSHGSQGSSVRLERLQMSPAGAFSCTGSLAEMALRGGTITNRAVNMVCSRKMGLEGGFRVAQSATLTVDSEEGQIVYHFPALAPPVKREAAPIPIGSVVAFAGTTPPDGWLLCDGGFYSAKAYPELAVVIQDVYGAKFEHFRVPDLRGRFVRGLNGSGDGENRDVDGANRQLGSVQGYATAMPKVPFKVTGDGSHSHGGIVLESDGVQTLHSADNTPGEPRLDRGHGISGGGHGHGVGGGDTETRPANMALNYIIHAGRKSSGAVVAGPETH
ncbi:tail fiber protein [Corallococcus sp. AB038B]|uniref:tail fiber protein n=1 Tax=Corallococcus sp. AB038B TaxID=2316718 RepID=UPI000ED459EF|nr:tail fiber protein [Corallococcus sp. AB038B]RKH93614.1 tail fiber protein [Corallococcus sp. AB038B]